MNKITSKYCSIFADNKIRKIQICLHYCVEPKYVNKEKREYKHWYQSVHKQKLGKAKRYGNISRNSTNLQFYGSCSNGNNF